MTILYVLDVVDFVPLAKVAADNPDVNVMRRGPYYEITSDRTLVIDRNATGLRNAIWFSSVAAIQRGRVARWDKEVLCIESSTELPRVTSVADREGRKI
ncbi:hypothetical protein [Rhodococcus wratislaviensis]|uniref:Uncharacterized protein n=1 Tax=Rhodococcus wratislaviensis NBRC 100605 TaxID=1219028 RepID=X0PTN4_RHOWR|nr:hypothetical protein [Rhodococcus wratislaviensis]GAF46433.1 hypothetical protein RW1_031_00150 [Rhodococcus wratislaviensis NBRC 100605]